MQNEELVQRIEHLEAINADLVSQRKESKGQNTRTQELEQQVQMLSQERDQLKQTYDNQIKSLMVQEKLKDLVQAQNDDAYGQVSQLVLDEAQITEDGIRFLDSEGNVRFNADQPEVPYSLEDKITELKSGPKSYLFKPDQGSGTAPENGNTSSASNIGSIIDANLSYG